MQEVLKPLMGTTDSPPQNNLHFIPSHIEGSVRTIPTPPPPPPPPLNSHHCRRDSLTSHLSIPSNTDSVCRICHCESEIDAPLISPCVCSGSLQYVHQACLQQWIKSADTKSCELCKFDFQMTTKVKPFKKWQKLEMSTVERRKVMCSVTFHVIAITCVIWSLYVLIDRTTEEIIAGKLEWPFWTKLIVVGIGFTGGVVFMYMQCKMYAQLCRQWRAYNRVIYIENCPEKKLRKLSSPIVCGFADGKLNENSKIPLHQLPDSHPSENSSKSMNPQRTNNSCMQESELL